MIWDRSIRSRSPECNEPDGKERSRIAARRNRHSLLQLKLVC